MNNGSQPALPRWLPPLLHEVLASASAALADTEWILVGALARDYAFRDSDDLGTLRATNDVDLATVVQDWAEFDAIVGRLCDSSLFRPTNLPHRLRHSNGQLMDFLPFGGVEKDHHIAWPPYGTPAMNVMGFTDVLDASPQVLLPGGIQMRIAPAYAVAFLKLVAWHDNPAKRDRDVEDIAAFVKGYITEIVGWDQAFQKYETTMTSDDFDLEEAGAYVLGRDISSFLSPGLHEQVLELVADLTRDTHLFSAILQKYLQVSAEHACRVCKRLLQGFRESSESL